MNRLVYIFLGGVVGGGVVWACQFGSFRIAPSEMKFEVFVGILLTGISLILAVVGLGVALIAFWGFTNFRTMVREASESAAVPAAISRIESELEDGELKRHIERLVFKFLEERWSDPATWQLMAERARQREQNADIDKGWFEVDEDNHA